MCTSLAALSSTICSMEDSLPEQKKHRFEYHSSALINKVQSEVLRTLARSSSDPTPLTTHGKSLIISIPLPPPRLPDPQTIPIAIIRD